MAENIVPAVKPGWKTSEFYVSIVTASCGLLSLFGILTPEEAGNTINNFSQVAGGLVAMVATVGYALARGKAKQSVDVNAMVAMLTALGNQAAANAKQNNEGAE